MQYAAALILILLIVLVLGLVLYMVRGSARYYRGICSEAHDRLVIAWITEMLGRGTVTQPSREDRTAWVTEAGVALSYTRHPDPDGHDGLHVALSEARGYTSGAVSQRVLAVLLLTLDRNRCDLHLFRSATGVRHLVLVQRAAADWSANPPDYVLPRVAEFPRLAVPLAHP